MKAGFLRTLLAAILLAAAGAVLADDVGEREKRSCAIPPATVAAIQAQLAHVATMSNGGLFSPSRMWSAVVDRQGMLCSVIKFGDAWPASRAIAIAKASTANGFSNDQLALSTANLYAPTQPGGPLYGLNNSNPFDPAYLAQGSGTGHVEGGVITFGGGLPLYAGGKVIGGLGLSGDTACADHVIAWRMRKGANLDLDKVPAGVAPDGTDNIVYAAAGAAPGGFQHPHCGTNDVTP